MFIDFMFLFTLNTIIIIASTWKSIWALTCNEIEKKYKYELVEYHPNFKEILNYICYNGKGNRNHTYFSQFHLD